MEPVLDWLGAHSLHGAYCVMSAMRDSAKRLGSGLSGGGLKLLRDFAVLSGGQVVSKIIGFVAFASLARTLQPEGYGTVEYVVGLSIFFGTFVEFGLGVVGVRRIAAAPGQLPTVAAQIPVLRLVVAVLSVPLMLLIAAPAVQGTAARGLLGLFAVSLLATPWRQDWLLQATERMSEAAIAQVVRTMVFALVILTLVRQSTDLLIVGWAEIAAVSAMSVYCVAVQQAKITPFRWRAGWTGLSELAKEGGMVGLGSFVWSANQYAPLLLVGSLVGGEETAWFAAASRVIVSLLAFSNLYYFNLYPVIAGATTRDRDTLASILGASFRVVAWGGTFVALALTLLAEPLSVLAFGDKFGQSASLLMVMAWVLPITLLSGHARWFMVAVGRQSRVVYAQVAGSIAMAVLGVPLVLLGGGRGAAVASLAAAVAVWLASHALAMRIGGRVPAFGPAVIPGALALVVMGGIHMAGLAQWSAGLGVLLFAAVAPFVDRKLWPDLIRLGAARVGNSTCPEPAG